MVSMTLEGVAMDCYMKRLQHEQIPQRKCCITMVH